MSNWNEALHPRVPKGQHDGGHFAPKVLSPTLEVAEAKIRNQPIEFLVVIDPKTHRLVKMVAGDESSVDIGGLRRTMRGKIVSHNHPSDESFSIEDVMFSSCAKTKETRAVGEHHTYSIQPVRARHWPLLESIDLAAKLGRYLSGTRELSAHQTWVNVAPRLGLKYTRKWVPSKP